MNEVVNLTLKQYDADNIQATVRIARGSTFEGATWVESMDGELGTLFADFVGTGGEVEVAGAMTDDDVIKLIRGLGVEPKA